MVTGTTDPTSNDSAIVSSTATYSTIYAPLDISDRDDWHNGIHDGANAPNALTGSLPSSLGATWTNLERFSVNINAISGSLPSTLGTTWTNLEWFFVGRNALTGSLPSTLGATWTNLKQFAVSSNALAGSFPSDMASRWNQLESIYLNDMFFVGSVPSQLCTSKTSNMTLWADCKDKVACSCCDKCF